MKFKKNEYVYFKSQNEISSLTKKFSMTTSVACNMNTGFCQPKYEEKILLALANQKLRITRVFKAPYTYQIFYEVDNIPILFHDFFFKRKKKI